MIQTTPKSINVPFIPQVDEITTENIKSFLAANDAAAIASEETETPVAAQGWEQLAEGKVDIVNWAEYPYAPQVSFKIARGTKAIALYYRVKGQDLRAVELTDNGRSWEDSCCEFFISPNGKEYFNFEITCIGSILAAHGEGRHNRQQVPTETVNKIVRASSLKHQKYEIEGGEYTWSLAVIIPFEVIGIDPANIPSEVTGNFYKCGDLTAHPHFVSWSPIGTENPDFHCPQFFGKLIF